MAKNSILIFFFLFVVSMITLSLSLYDRALEKKPVLETEKTEMKRMPPDIKKIIEQTPITTTLRVPILMYHYVEYVADKKDTLRVALNINPDIFEQQLKTLKAGGYTFLTAKDLGDILNGKEKMPPKPILLTFDDGHWDFDTVVLPLLKKYHIKATAYVIPGFTGGSDFMTQAQVEDVIQSGLVDVGAHTVHHIALKGKPFFLVENEVEGSKKMLEDTYHIKVVSFAYPDGSFDQQAVSIVKSAGFTTAVSTIPGEDVNQTNKFFIYRLRPGYRVGETLLVYLQNNPWTPKIENIGNNIKITPFKQKS